MRSHIIAPAILYTGLCATLLGVSVSRATTIGVNFGAPDQIFSFQTAGVAPYAQSIFNNVMEPAVNRYLNASDGSYGPATLTTNGATSFGNYVTTANPDEILNSDRANGGSTWSFTINQIPYASYSIIVYDLDSVVGAVKGITIGSTTFYTSSPLYNAPGYIDNNSATPFTYTRGTSTDSLNPTPLSDYVMFDGLSGSNQTVSISFISGSAVTTRVGGFQIVETPEPGTCGLLIGAIGVLGMRRLRGRKG